MNEKTLTALAMRTLAGEDDARQKLLAEAYAPVSYQCRLILRDWDEAQSITDDIMQMLNGELDSLNHPADFSKWMQRLIASKCSDALGYLHWYGAAAEPDEEAVEVIPAPGKFLDETQTAFYVADIIEHLPGDSRLCAVLYGCGGMSLEDISRHTDFSEAVVRRQLDLARNAVQTNVKRCQEEGVTFIALGSMPIMLSAAMEFSRDRRLAAAEAARVLSQFAPDTEQEETPKKEKQSKPGRKKRRKKKANWLGRIFLTLVVLCALAAMVLFGAILIQELGII